MLVLLPVAALASVWLAMVSRGFGLRRSLLGTALAGAAFAVAVNEFLSPFQAVDRFWLSVAWAGAGLAGAARIRPDGVRAAWARWRFPVRAPLAWATLAACAFSLTGAFLSAVLGPPNMADALTYHMPRVVYWQVHQSVNFYPANFYQQLSLQPFSEYAMLHLYVLAESDQFVQLAQWAIWAAAIAAASLTAQRLGADWRGQALAAGLCAALPSGVLQASGAKPDVLVAGWLLIAIYFALGARDEDWGAREAAGAGLASGLALLSKGTAYVFGAGIAPFLLLGMGPIAGRRLFRQAPLLVGVALLVNAPHYARNFAYNGHPLGNGTPNGHEEDRFANDRISVGATVSNLLRNLPQQLVFRPEWNQAIFDAVVAAHESLGLDPQDRATTWSNTRYRMPAVSRHEGEAANVRHLLLLAPMLPWLLWRRRWDPTAALALGCLGGAILFCALLKWQPWHARMHLPLFVIVTPVMGVFLSRLRPRALAVAALVWLTWSQHPFVLHNALRPVAGERPVYTVERFSNFFRDWPRLRVSYALGADLVARTGCRRVGIDTSLFTIEYPLMARLRAYDFGIQFRQESVGNASNRYADRTAFEQPCAVLCPDCAGDPSKWGEYARFGPPDRIDSLLVFTER